MEQRQSNSCVKSSGSNSRKQWSLASKALKDWVYSFIHSNKPKAITVEIMYVMRLRTKNKPDSFGMLLFMYGTIGEGAMKGRNGWGDVSGDIFGKNPTGFSDEPKTKIKQTKSSHFFSYIMLLKIKLQPLWRTAASINPNLSNLNTLKFQHFYRKRVTLQWPITIYIYEECLWRITESMNPNLET